MIAVFAGTYHIQEVFKEFCKVGKRCLYILSLQVLEGEAAGLLGIQSAIGTYEVDADKTGRQVSHTHSSDNMQASRRKGSHRRGVNFSKEAVSSRKVKFGA